ncbi:MAG: hypothetical protein PHE56_02235 [Bacteroidales bacterium]|nr:hypothetical protein [Bacteroidales bacterium]
MNIRIKSLIILMCFFAIGQISLKGQTITESERIIYLMRAKQFYGSGVNMNLMINGELFHKIKNGNRLIIKTNSNDTLNIQIIYPPIRSYKSRVLQITPDNASVIYIDLFYWGEGYNPFKHAGVLNPVGGTPDFNIEIVEMTLDKGKKKFVQTKLYKDNNIIMQKYFKSK